MTTFYGRCNHCGKGLVAEVRALSARTMLGPSITLLCQEHLPVGEADAVRIDCVGAADRAKIKDWMRREGMPVSDD